MKTVRKDVERFFGVLQSWFEVSQQRKGEYSANDVVVASKACMTVYNVIVSKMDRDLLCKTLWASNSNQVIQKRS